jgi:hypothetical protein
MEETCALPNLDGIRVDAELGGQLLQREEALSPEPGAAVRESVGLAEPLDGGAVEVDAGSGAASSGVENVDHFAYGVLAEEVVDLSDHGGGCPS